MYLEKAKNFIEISKFNKLFQLLKSIHIYQSAFSTLICMLMKQNLDNVVSKDSPVNSLCQALR